MSILPEVWKNKWKILEGIKNRTFKREHIEELAKHRKSICKTCPWYSENQRGNSLESLPEAMRKAKSDEWLLDRLKQQNEHCMFCSCDLSMDSSIKLRCLSTECPIGQWAAVSNEEEEQMIIDILKNELPKV